MVLRERTSSIRSVWKGCSGNGNRRGCSSAKACATVRALSSGQERWCATFTPHQRLAIAFRQRGEDAASPEGISYVPNRSFHAAFLISRPYLARTWREVIVRGQFQQPRVEMNLVSAALQHCTAQIVVKNDTRRARPVLKGAHVSAQKVLCGLVEEELQIQCSRPGQGDDEAGKLPFSAADHDRTEVGPVRLCLLGGKNLQPEEGFMRLRAQTGHHAP